MTKFHINDEGNALKCGALKGRCPYGDDSTHYSSETEARFAYEEAMSYNFQSYTLSKKDPYSQLSLEAANKLLENASTPLEEELYQEFAQRLAGGSFSELNRAHSLYSHRALLAHEFDKEEEKQIYFNAFKIVAAAFEKRHRDTLYQEGLDALAQKGDDFTRQPDIERGFNNAQRAYESSIDAVLSGEDVFNDWELMSEEIRFSPRETSVTDPNLREVLSQADQVHLGRISQGEYAQARKQLEAQGRELLQALTLHGASIQSLNFGAAKAGLVSGAEDFELIAGGAEMNVYLHRPTSMVYKLRHSDGLGSEEDSDETARVAVVQLEERYKNSKLSALSAADASYVKTHFMTTEDAQGKLVNLVAQPYLDPNRYGPYELSAEEKSYMKRIGLNDLHSGNMSIDSETGKIVLFDCIFVQIKGNPELSS